MFAYLHQKWLVAKTPVKVDFYFEEMKVEVRDMLPWELKVAHQIMREGCRVKRKKFRP